MEWQHYPTMEVTPDFANWLTDRLREVGAAPEAPLLFICRSGARSMSAAQALGEKDANRKLINVSDGFEGPKDDGGHRGKVLGWKVANLPWEQN